MSCKHFIEHKQNLRKNFNVVIKRTSNIIVQRLQI